MNLKGRNPLHELCKYGKENAAAICELFFECMPDYPINKQDLEVILLVLFANNVFIALVFFSPRVTHRSCWRI